MPGVSSSIFQPLFNPLSKDFTILSCNLERDLDGTGFDLIIDDIDVIGDVNATNLNASTIFITNLFATNLESDLDGTGYDLNIKDVNSLGNITGDINWTYLDTYPTACTGNSDITALGDSVTCTDDEINIGGDTAEALKEFNWGYGNLTNISDL